MQNEIDLTLRAAHRSEARAIAGMSRVLIEHGLHWRWTPARVRRQINDPDTMVLVASRQGEICGFAIMYFGDSDAHLLLLAVAPQSRRAHIGTALLQWLEKSATTAGIERIRLEVRASNSVAARFYTINGYQTAGVVEGYYDGREAAVVFVKRLRASAEGHRDSRI